MTQKGVWGLQDVRDEYLAGNWSYTSNDSYSLFTWGSNSQGQFGVNDVIPRSSPIQVPGTQWSGEIKEQPLVIKTDGSLWAWGYGAYGSLGLNDIVTRSSPTQVPGTQWDRVSKHGSRRISAVFKTDGTLWMWGDNDEGHLAINDIIRRSSPVQLPGTWNHISGGEAHMYGTTTSGELYFWGRGLNGSSGQNAPSVSRSSPTQIPGTGWNKVSCGNGSYSGYFTKTDGSLWALGQNSFGEMGQNDAVDRSSPVQIPGSQWDTVYGGTQGTVATKTDGTLWVWGTGGSGNLGQNDTVPRSSPVQIPGTNWALGYNRMARPFYSTIALKTDGTMWAWGAGGNGQFGVNDVIPRSSPVQIPGTQWTRVANAFQSTFMATKNN